MKIHTSGRLAAILAATTGLLACAGQEDVRLMTLDPGHFHAALVQKSMYPGVDPVVNVYAPDGPDLDLHLARIEGFNNRPEAPTTWKTIVHRCDDPLETMVAQSPGNVVILSGNNARKTESILACVDAGLNVLADKPMVITPAGLKQLRRAFEVAEENGVLLYDVMTERHEITTVLQRALAHQVGLFGEQQLGSPEQPAVTKESVHHYFKYVSGKPLRRPWWFFDVSAQGEGVVDVTTHLVDLIQWELFPEEALLPEDVAVLAARTWVTELTPAAFEKVTGLETFPDELAGYVNEAGVLEVPCNGEFTYTLRGVHCKVSVTWNYEAPAGARDTHYSIMRGSMADLVIRQGADEGYEPTLYVEPAVAGADLAAELEAAIARLEREWPGVGAERHADGWRILIPERYRVGHEAHFAQVTEAYLGYLAEGGLPDWEVPNMLLKHHTIMEAYRMSR